MLTTTVGGTPEVPAKGLPHILSESTEVPVTVRLIESLRLPPGCCAVVPVAVEGGSREAWWSQTPGEWANATHWINWSSPSRWALAPGWPMLSMPR